MGSVLDKLTENERQVLELVMRGEKSTTIAAKLDMGVRTVELRRAKIAEKFNAKNFVEVVRIAIAAGL